MLFAVHYILFRMSKYSNDKFNRVLKNFKNKEAFRTTINSSKSIFGGAYAIEERFDIYLSYCLKY